MFEYGLQVCCFRRPCYRLYVWPQEETGLVNENLKLNRDEKGNSCSGGGQFREGISQEARALSIELSLMSIFLFCGG